MSDLIPPPETKRRDVRNFFSSVKYALDGFWAAVRHEPSFREDLIFVAILTPFAVILPVNAVSTAVMITTLLIPGPTQRIKIGASTTMGVICKTMR